MATVTCPHCAQSFDLADNATGKPVRCPQCQQTFTAASSAVASGEPPLRSKADPSSEADGPPKRRDVAAKSSMALPIILVAAIVLVGLCVCGAPVLVLMGGLTWGVARHEAHQADAEVLVAKAGAGAQAAKAEVRMAMQRGFAKGADDARNAIDQDKLLLKEHPPIPAPGWHGDYIKLLKEKCKCDYVVVGEPNLPKDKVEEIRGWNDTMQAELRQRHGETILADLNKEAEQRWRERIKEKAKK